MEKKRRKLFSEISPAKPLRRKLFSTPLVVAVCHDCGCEIKTGDETTTNICPECGGKRFDIPSKVSDKNFSQTKSISTRRKLFGSNAERFTADDRMFSTGMGSEFENLLGQWQGKEMDKDYSMRIFSGVDLVNEGLATNSEEGKIKVFSMAEEVEKMFSSLKITVIKELSLDPVSAFPGPSEVISQLAVDKSLPAKTVVLMKKAHSLPKDSIFSETSDWVKDSGLVEDLEEEFGGKDFTPNEIKNILEERFEDAPENTIEYLKESGVLEETPEGNLHIKK